MESRSESGRTTGGGREKANTHFFQPATLRIQSWKCWKQLNASYPINTESSLQGGKNLLYTKENQVSQSGKS